MRASCRKTFRDVEKWSIFGGKVENHYNAVDVENHSRRSKSALKEGRKSKSGQGPRPMNTDFYRWLDFRTFLRRRIDTGVTSTNSSSRMNSMACSRFRMRGGTSLMASSAVDARMLVSFFSLTMF